MSFVEGVASTALYKEDIGFIQSLLVDKLPFEWEQISESKRVPNSKKPGYSEIYVNKYCYDNNSCIPYTSIHPSIKTTTDIYAVAFKVYRDLKCLGKRKFNKKTGKYDNFFTFDTYRETEERQKNFGAGFVKIVRENRFKTADINVDDFILTLYSCNRQEWVLTDMACQFRKICNTSLYDSLGPETSSYILKLTDSPICVCSKDKLDVLLKIKQKEDIKTLITVVSMDDLDPEDEHYYSLFNEVGIELFDFRTVERIGEQYPSPYRPTSSEDLYTISFTSGTTGLPKGVMIPQSQAVAGASFSLATVRRPEHSGDQPFDLCFLPLAHIYQRQSLFNAMAKGYGLGFPQDGLPTSLLENLQILKPHSLACVPRVYSKFEAAIKDKIQQPGLAAALARNTIRAKELKQSSKDNETGRLFLRDKIIIDKIRASLGFDNMVNIVSGSAPISPETCKFLKAALNVGFAQGYGLTESFAGICVSNPLDAHPGSCGPIGLTGEMRLKDIPAMKYTSDDPTSPKGEILLRGPQIFSQYYKNEKATKEALDDEGWFHTGDVATIDERGQVYIIDRVKNFFKLAQGEYITPERIENIYLSQSPTLTQLYIHGDSLKNFLVAIAGVDAVRLRKILSQLGLTSKYGGLSDKDLVKTFNKLPNLKKHLLEELHMNVKDEGLQGYEKFHNIYVDIEPLKVEDEVITPTMKIKRNIAKNFFQREIDSMYEEGSLIKGSKL